MNHKVSVIIPAYNIGHLIRETIDSILAQTYSNFEIIIVDDGSKDNTAQVVKSYKDARIIYHYQQNSGLPAKGRNAGARLAKGDLLAFLDHDDLWMPDKLEKQVGMINKDPDVVLVSTNAYFLYGSERTSVPMIGGMRSGYFTNDNLFPINKVIQSSVLMSKKIYDLLGGLNENSDLKAIEDYDLWLRICEKYPCYYLNDCLVYYRKHGMSASGSEMQMVERELLHFNKYFSKYNYPKKLKDLRISYIKLHLAYFQLLARNGEWRRNMREAFFANANLIGLVRYLFSFLPYKVVVKINEYRKHKNKKQGVV